LILVGLRVFFGIDPILHRNRERLRQGRPVSFTGHAPAIDPVSDRSRRDPACTSHLSDPWTGPNEAFELLAGWRSHRREPWQVSIVVVKKKVSVANRKRFEVGPL